MSTSFPAGLNQTDWRTLYRAAILEANNNILPQRILEAEQAVVARGRELFHDRATLEEMDELEDALYTLRAFRTSWQHSEAA
jgi:hypothetical protein